MTGHPSSTTEATEATGSARSARDRARDLVQRFVADSPIPGMSLAVATPDAELLAVSAGHADLATRRPATVEDQYLWFSMSKIATATAAVQLHASGRLDLDVPIGDYLPTYRPHRTHGHPSLRQLLSHTAGLTNPLPVRWIRPEDEPVASAHHQRIVRRHGTPRRPVGGLARYSNIGYLLAGDVIEAVTGLAVQDHVTRAVLHPLGMTATGYRADPDRPRSVGHVRMPAAARPALRRFLPGDLVGRHTDGYSQLLPFVVNGPAYGGLIGTVTDAAKLAAAHVVGMTDATSVLPYGEVEQMRTITARGKPFDHGIGWFRRPTDVGRAPGFVEHYGTGGGYWNAMRICPERRLAIVAMTNTTSAWDVDRLFTQIEDLPWT